MKTKTIQVTSDSEIEMLTKKSDIEEKLGYYKSRHPDFNFTIEIEDITNTLIVKQILMDVSSN